MKSTIQTTPLLQVAEISISYSSIVKPSQRPKIASSRDAYEIMRDNWNEGSIEHREEMRIMLLNRGNKVIGIFLVSVGGFAGTVCDPKVVFQAALKANASSIILAHNHPSGNLKPSDADLKLTEKLKKGGLLLDIAILDHLILTEEAYLSFADEGLI
ncbi:JAB domain-containing protein [Mucilaginibacter arboris]|uniref:DNA repair protein n=1 Tax=Mucilaginibacter arboris TaxID=2682090 RepID=A0A7K1T087_9SPHI|nr:JAB domain-containing protein [Mucilaginibacter arboris]MVN22981.1 DNA repair protein [Mucilaginibacter arboris]